LSKENLAWTREGRVRLDPKTVVEKEGKKDGGSERKRQGCSLFLQGYWE